MNHIRWHSAILSLQVFLALTPAHAQSQHWNMQAREKSQNLNSRALNFLLLEQNKSGKKSGLDEAIPLLHKACEEDPNDPIPYATLGLAQDMKGEYQQALDSLSKSYRLNGKAGETILSIGLTQYLGHDYDKAISAFSTVLGQHPEMTQVNACIAFAHMRRGDLDRAIQAFRQFVTNAPTSHIGHHGLALCYLLSGNLSAAQQSAQRAQSIKSYPPVLTILCEIATLQGDTALAKTSADEYARLVSNTKRQDRSMTAIGFATTHDFHWDPYLAEDFDNPSLVAARWLTSADEEKKRKSLLQKGKIDKVSSALEKALSTGGNDFYLAHQSGLVQLAKGSGADAVNQFMHTLEAAPNCNVDLLNLARSYALCGKQAEASQAVRKFQELHPQERLSAFFIEAAKFEPPAPQAPPPPVQPVQSTPASGF
jgi:tetratricopeptide (TPR) repeat protein